MTLNTKKFLTDYHTILRQDLFFLISHIYHKIFAKKPNKIMTDKLWYKSWKYGSKIFNTKLSLNLGDWFYSCKSTGLLKGQSILNVGLNPNSGDLWLKFFKYDLGFKNVFSIEVWPANIRRLKLIGSKFSIENYDVRYLHKRYPPNYILGSWP